VTEPIEETVNDESGKSVYVMSVYSKGPIRVDSKRVQIEFLRLLKHFIGTNLKYVQDDEFGY
jgi:hypothetical protein